MKDSRRRKYFYSLLLLIGALYLFPACKSKKAGAVHVNQNSDALYVSADESFKPIVDELVQVYESDHRGKKVFVQYKPEADCLRDFGVDSIRMVIATRGYSADEKILINDSLKVSVESMTVARDAIAVIVNPAAPELRFTMKDIREILEGRFKENLIPVFDGVKATSTVRFVIDSILKGSPLTSSAVAARSSEGVINYVASDKNVVGFIGVSWIGNPEDTIETGFLRKVKMADLESTDTAGYFVKPSQANIYIKRYPMVRDLVYTVKENYKGPAHQFADFMSGEIGQLIFRRAYLAPAQLNLGIRPIQLRE